MFFHLFPSDPLAWEPGTQWHPRFYMFLQSHAALPRIKHGKHTEETSLRALDEWWRLKQLRLAWTNSECWSFMKNAEIQESLKTTSKQKVYTTESLLYTLYSWYKLHSSICLFWTEVRWVQTAAAAWIPSGQPAHWPNGCQEACPKISQQSHLKCLARETGLDLANWPGLFMVGNNEQ